MSPHERLKRFRLAAGLSQEALGTLLGCDQTYVGLVERGKREPGTAFTHRLEALSGDWDEGAIRTEEWLSGPMPEPVAIGAASPVEPHVEYDDAPRTPSTMLPPRMPTIPQERLSTIPPPATRRPSSIPPPSRPSEPPSPEGPLFIEGTNVADELDEFGQALGEVFGDPTEVE